MFQLKLKKNDKAIELDFKSELQYIFTEAVRQVKGDIVKRK